MPAAKQPPSSGSKLFSACLVADYGEIRLQCSALDAQQKGPRRHLVLSAQSPALKLDAENVIDWQNTPGDTGDTPLIVCCWRGDAFAAKILLDAGADVRLCNRVGVSPLLMACHQGNRECAMLCLASGANVDDADDREFTPVYAAACGGHSEIVHDCIVVGADVSGATGARALIACCHQGHVECAALLVHAGADSDAHHQGKTAIEWATHCGHSKTARVVELCTKMRGACSSGALVALDAPPLRDYATSPSEYDRRLKKFASSQFQTNLLGISSIDPVGDRSSPILADFADFEDPGAGVEDELLQMWTTDVENEELAAGGISSPAVSSRSPAVSSPRVSTPEVDRFLETLPTFAAARPLLSRWEEEGRVYSPSPAAPPATKLSRFSESKLQTENILGECRPPRCQLRPQRHPGVTLLRGFVELSLPCTGWLADVGKGASKVATGAAMGLKTCTSSRSKVVQPRVPSPPPRPAPRKLKGTPSKVDLFMSKATEMKIAD